MKYVRYRLQPSDFQPKTDPYAVPMNLQADFDVIGPYYLDLGVEDMSSDPFPEYVQAVGYMKEGRLLAFLMVMALEDDGTLEIAAVSTHPEHRGKGYGTAIISWAADYIMKRGFVPSLTTGTENHSMRRAAEKIGMKVDS